MLTRPLRRRFFDDDWRKRLFSQNSVVYGLYGGQMCAHSYNYIRLVENSTRN